MKLKKLAASLLAAAMLFCGTATTAFADGGCDGGWDDDLDDILEEIDIDIPDIDIDVEKTWKRGEAEGEIQLPKPDDVNVKVQYGNDEDECVSVGVKWDKKVNHVTVIPEKAASVTWKGEIDLEDIIKAIIADIIPSGGKASQANGGFDWGDDLKNELKTILQKVITALTKPGTNMFGDMFGEKITGNDANQWRLESTTFKLLDGWKLDPTLKLTNTYTGDNGDGGDEEEEDTVSITVNKVWEGDENYPNARPEKITVRLLADNKVVEGKTLTLSAGNNWTDKFTDLKKYKDNTTTQEKITYTVEEVEVLKGYDSEIKTVESGFTITNTYKAPVEIKQDVTFTKKFALANGVDPNHVPLTAYFSFVLKREDSSLPFAEKRFSYEDGSDKTITFNDVPVGTYILTESIGIANRDWTTSIPKDGVKVSVTKEGVTFGDNHENTLVVTNTYTKKSTIPDTVSISVEKKWSDGNENHENDSITVIVNQKVGDKWIYAGKCAVLSKSNDWKYSFDGLFKYKADGKTEIEYTVKEEKVPDGYEAKVTGGVENGFIITNTYTGDEEEKNPKVSFPKYFKLINATADDVKGHEFTFTLTPWRVELREAGEGNTIKSKTVSYDANGVMVTFDEDVPAGHYLLEEILPEGVDGWETSIPDGVMVYINREGIITLPTNDGAENKFSVTNTYKKTDSTPIDRDDEEEEEKDESDLTVKKVDNETGKLITEKATFRIYKLSGSRKLYYTGSSWSSNVEKAKEYSTKNGKFTAYDLGAGTYYVEEVKAPSGYNLADDLKVKLTSKDKTVEFANSKAKQNPNTGALVLPLDLADAAVAAMTLGAAAWVISKSKK